MTGQALIVQGDALKLPLPDESVDLIVTSPPYFALRAYSAGPGEIGSEATPAEFLEALWAATREMARVLKPTGSIFVMLGDKYGRPGGGVDVNPRSLAGVGNGYTQRVSTPTDGGGREKSLMGLPWRYAIGCMDGKAGDALILRSEIIWSKPNGLLPESVTDRVRRSHEQVFHLTRQPRYYSAIDEVREAHQHLDHMAKYAGRYGRADDAQPSGNGHSRIAQPNPLGKLPGSVWTIASEPLRLPGHLGVQHYAAMPSEWPRRLILGWSPPGICMDCGQGRVPVVERGEYEQAHGDGPVRYVPGETRNPHARHGEPGSTLRLQREATILGYACACTPHTNHPGSGGLRSTDHGRSLALGNGVRDNPGGGYGNAERTGPWREYHLDGWKPPPTRPAVVLDPFSGVGTTVGVARQLGRIGIGVDLSHPYCRAAKWRVFDSGSFSKAQSRTWADRQGVLL